MSFTTSYGTEIPYMHQELVRDRIQTLHREAEEQRLASRVRRVRKARKEAERATTRLRNVLERLT